MENGFLNREEITMISANEFSSSKFLLNLIFYYKTIFFNEAQQESEENQESLQEQLQIFQETIELFNHSPANRKIIKNPNYILSKNLFHFFLDLIFAFEFSKLPVTQKVFLDFLERLLVGLFCQIFIELQKNYEKSPGTPVPSRRSGEGTEEPKKPAVASTAHPEGLSNEFIENFLTVISNNANFSSEFLLNKREYIISQLKNRSLGFLKQCFLLKKIYFNKSNFLLHPINLNVSTSHQDDLFDFLFDYFMKSSNECSSGVNTPSFDFSSINFWFPSFSGEEIVRGNICGIRRIEFHEAFTFIQLPNLYQEFTFANYFKSTCENCKQIIKSPALCLICGKLLCATSACCGKKLHRIGNERNNYFVGECCQVSGQFHSFFSIRSN